MEFDLKMVSEGLGLTPQQFDILQCVYQIHERGIVAAPKAIQEEYRKLRGKHLMKPNLFNVLRLLKNKGHIKQTEYACYEVDFDFVEKTLRQKKEERYREISEFEKVVDEVDAYFSRIKVSQFKPVVEYLEYDQFYHKLAQLVRVAKVHYVVGKFAKISYTPTMLAGIGRAEYVKAIYDGCFKKRLKAKYLTNLDIDYLYHQALQTYKNPGLAYLECQKTIENLCELRKMDNVDIVYTERLFGLDLVLPEKIQPIDVFLYIRDNREDIIGGVHIGSPDVGKRAKEMFLRECESGINLKTKKGENIIRNVRMKLKGKYGRFS
ncbi:MAG: hypothetical protein V1875_02750 [Candidatus Altiarchaeota archaeon]